ncbi:hypothetical protein Hypma_011023 [Hypsizygus marmoreus]|uniref:Uncharacterized protein n=1 Tax=Hypsizygus marmoreus TaxID=39966 RepID=A0A369JIF7_HYPMA|nr:hypothetical protein Hypma_011023 [Hypsizygus marmoreus]
MAAYVVSTRRSKARQDVIEHITYSLGNTAHPHPLCIFSSIFLCGPSQDNFSQALTDHFIGCICAVLKTAHSSCHTSKSSNCIFEHFNCGRKTLSVPHVLIISAPGNV